MLSIQNISRQYPGTSTPAVRNVSLEVPQGEILALVGQSGSGKTTLMRLISGLEIPDSGKILVDGTEVADAAGKTWVAPHKRRVGLVFQDGALFPHLTVAKNVAYGLSRKEFPKEERQAITANMLEMTGLQDYRDRFPHQLSGGERQRLAVARALAPKPKLILLDEPFSNLDPALRPSIREDILSILRASDITAILVTHDTDDALAIGDRIAVFREGQIEQIGSPYEIYHHPQNGYCARLFGPANCLHQADGKTEWIRPEDMQLKPEKTEDSDIAVKVCEIRDTGRHLEARVQGDQETWIVPITKEDGFQEGDSVWGSVKED